MFRKLKTSIWLKPCTIIQSPPGWWVLHFPSLHLIVHTACHAERMPSIPPEKTTSDTTQYGLVKIFSMFIQQRNEANGSLLWGEFPFYVCLFTISDFIHRIKPDTDLNCNANRRGKLLKMCYKFLLWQRWRRRHPRHIAQLISCH